MGAQATEPVFTLGDGPAAPCAERCLPPSPGPSSAHWPSIGSKRGTA